MPSGNVADGARLNVPVSNAGASHTDAVQKPPVEAKPNAANLQNAIDNINKLFKQSAITAQFKIDPDTKRDVVQMLDSSTGEVIMQYPSEVTLAISKAIDQEIKRGVLLSQKA